MDWHRIAGLTLGIIGGIVLALGLLAWQADYKDRQCNKAFDVDVAVTACMEKPGCFYEAQDFIELRTAEMVTRRCRARGWVHTL